jgi:SagB-type dehydrogenase family enzyme
MTRPLLVLWCTLAGAACQSQPCSCHGDGGDARADADQGCPPCDASCVDAQVQPEPGDEAALLRIIEARRSFRDFADGSVTREDVEALFRAAQGVTLPGAPTGREGVLGLRTAPSAGATYPLELYVAADRVVGLDPGLHRYDPETDRVEPTGLGGPLAAAIADAALGQTALVSSSAIFVFASVPERTLERYGTRGLLYIQIEVGHAAQNLLLMATARGVENVPIGAFDPADLRTALRLPEDQDPIYLIPVGHAP